jgi:hypothetical protein
LTQALHHPFDDTILPPKIGQAPCALPAAPWYTAQVAQWLPTTLTGNRAASARVASAT